MSDITGLNLSLTVGGWTVRRLPWGELTLERGAVAGRLSLELPDPQGELKLSKDDPVDLFFGYRGGQGQSQQWQGKITQVKAEGESVLVTALSPEMALIDTKVTECFHKESARQVVRRLISLSGLAPGRLEGPDETIPHLIFSGQPVYDCLRQVNATLERVYEHDMSAKVYWQGQDGNINWGDFDEPGGHPVFAACDNLVRHNPRNEEDGEVVGLLFPGLTHSQQFTVRDARRGLEVTKRAQAVRHQLGMRGNLTFVSYGKEKGYA